MKLYSSYQNNEIKTVRAQGQKIVEIYQQQQGMSITVKCIKRTGMTSNNSQWGFAVLETYNRTFICHYSLKFSSLVVTEEVSLSSFDADYLDCPQRFLSACTATNPDWRRCVDLYQAASKITSEHLVEGVVIFLTKPLELAGYFEPISVLTLENGEWYGLDSSALQKRLLPVGLEVIRAHCPSIIDVDNLNSIDTDYCDSDLVVTSRIIYKLEGDIASIVGRPMTNMEKINATAVSVSGTLFDMSRANLFC